jgi:hypothetical protein
MRTTLRLLCFLWLFVLPLFGEDRAGNIQVEYGIDEYVKQGRWFPVRVMPFPGARAFEIHALAKDFCTDRYYIVTRTFGRFVSPDGPGQVSCRLSGNASAIRCVVHTPEGPKQSGILEPDFVEQDNLFIIVVTDTPDQFRFLGSIQLPHRGGFHPVSCSAAAFPK